MQMAIRYILISFLILFVVSCAQIGTLSGGAKDEIAPKPIEEKSFPQQKTVNFNGNQLKITFDEYFKLNNPTENIIIIPADVQLKTKVDKKTLFINWNENLKTNTTYSVYFNNAVKDITEGNDSLMTFVFSTGSYIDSLSYKTTIVDAEKNTPIKNCLLGLYEHFSDTIIPNYFASSNSNGVVTINHLKAGKYEVVAFEDLNKDLKPQKTERIGFKNSVLELDSIQNDSLAIRLFKNKEKAKLTSLNFIYPNSFIVESNASLKEGKYFANGQALNSSEIQFLTENKLQFFLPKVDSSLKEISFVYQNQERNDTIVKRLLEKDKKGKLRLEIKNKNSKIYPGDTLKFGCTDKIISIDTTKIFLQNSIDSSIIHLKNAKLIKNTGEIYFSNKGLKQFKLIIRKEAIETIHTKNSDSLTFDLTMVEDKDLGAINIDLSAYQRPIVLQAILGENIEKEIPMESGKKFLLSNLEPGEYKFKVILDDNKNGKWDTGNFEEKIQPEEIHWYSELTKVRANWEIDLKIVPKK